MSEYDFLPLAFAKIVVESTNEFPFILYRQTSGLQEAAFRREIATLSDESRFCEEELSGRTSFRPASVSCVYLRSRVHLSNPTLPHARDGVVMSIRDNKPHCS